MRARIIVFPIKGRNWCYSRSIEPATAESHSNHTPSTLKDLWTKLNSSSSSADAKSAAANAELIIDFASNKMNQSWTSLEKAPPGSFKNKLYGLGLRLLARVKPSEMFLKSISKDVKEVEVAFPSSLNARLVRRRLRHIALRGTVIHKKYFYGSAALLPFTTVLTVLPLPNIPFFWILFRTYSHWRALQGSERLLQLVSDDSKKPNSSTLEDKKTEDAQKNDSESDSTSHLWVLRPSKELENVIQHADTCEGLSNSTISDICKTYNLHTVDVLKYRDLV